MSSYIICIFCEWMLKWRFVFFKLWNFFLAQLKNMGKKPRILSSNIMCSGQVLASASFVCIFVVQYHKQWTSYMTSASFLCVRARESFYSM